jgi:hypothetical protein
MHSIRDASFMGRLFQGTCGPGSPSSNGLAVHGTEQPRLLVQGHNGRGQDNIAQFYKCTEDMMDEEVSL